MKNTLYILLALTLVTVSCKNRKKATETISTITETVEAPVASEAPKMVEMANIEEEDIANMVVISLSKTACFGECPVYSVQFFGNGTVIYNGIQNVDNIGSFKGNVQVSKISSLVAQAYEMGYFKLKDSYDNEGVTDLPSATTKLIYNGKEKKVYCRYDCDPMLLKINSEIESLIQSISMKKME